MSLDLTDWFLYTESRPEIPNPFTYERKGLKNKQENYWTLFNNVYNLRRNIRINVYTKFDIALTCIHC